MKTIARTLRMTLALLTALAPFHGIPVSAQGVPARTHFQGRLTDASNNPLTGPNGFVFEIYDAASGGALLWTETQPAVAVANGVFAVQLGAATPLVSTVFSGATAYLQVTVNGNVMTPRERLVSAPFSHNTQLLSGREFAAFVSTDAAAQSIAGAKTFTGTVFVPAPTLPGHAASRAYVDAAGGTSLLVATNTWSGQNSFLNLISISSDLVVTGVLNRGTPLSIGGPLSVASGVTAASGTFTASGPAQFSLQTSSGVNVAAGGVYAPFFTGVHYGDGSQLSGLPAGGTDRVLRAGDTMTGQLTVTGSSLTVRSNGAASPFLVSTSPVAGTASLYVDGVGNVGVGTLAPAALLDLQGGAGPLLRMSARKNNGFEPIWDLRGDFNSSDFLTLTGNSVAVMQWGPGGANLGGSILNFPSARLSVAGSATALPLVLSTGSAPSQEVMRVNSIGSVGIGTTSPGTKLHVSSGALTIDGTGAGLALRDGTQGNAKVLTSDASGNATWQAAAGDSSKVAKAGDTMTGQLTIAGSSLTIRSNAAVSPLLVSTSATPGTASIYVDGTGKVGIGTKTPTRELDVVGVLQINGPGSSPPYALELRAGVAGIGMQTTSGNGAAIIEYRNSAGSQLANQTYDFGNNKYYVIQGGVPRFTVNYNGTVGVGTTAPAARLHVSSANAVAADMVFEVSSGTASGQELLVVKGDGKVGIGTTAPSTLFDVNGNAQFGSGVNKSTFSTTGALNLASGSALTLAGANGNIVSAASITASGFFGSGAGLTGLTGTDASRVLKSGDTMTGQLTLAGSTLTVQGDAFSVGGSTLVVVNGNVGLGTTAPASKLHLKADGAALRHEGDKPALLSYNSSAFSTSNRRKIFIGWAGDSRFAVEQRTDSEAGLNFRYLSFDLNNGNTGVGTSAVAPLAALHADGNTPFIASSAGIELLRVTGTSVTFAGGAVVMRSTEAAGAHAFLRLENNAGAELTRFQQDGRVGVGMTAPAANLHVSSANAVAADTIFQVSSGAAAGQELLVVKGDGRLGLGTISNARLHIAAPNSGTPALRIKTPDSFGGVVFLDVPSYGRLETFSSGGGFTLQGTGLSSVPSLRVSPPSGGDESLVANGKVAIGLNDNPDARLHVHYDGTLPAALNYNLKVTTGTPETTHFVVTTGGNVGVGTTSPASKMHVLDGDIRVSTSAGQPSKGIVFQDGSVQTTAAGGAGGGWTDTGSVVQLATPTDTIGSTGAGVTVSTHLIVSAGNVGIGTTGPTKRLTVVQADDESFTGLSGAAGNHTAIALGRTASEARLGIAAGAGSYAANAVAGDAILRVDDNTKKLHLLAGTGNAVMTVTGSNVGVGTANPGAQLHLQGLSASTTAQIVQRAGAGGTGANLTEWRTEAGGAMSAVDRSGRIIYGGDTALQGAGISLVTGDAAQPGLIVRGLAGQTADLQRWQGAGGAPLAVVTAAGSLGVGTAAPGNKLQVNVANASNDGMTVAAANGSSIFLGPDRGSGGSNALVQTGDASLIFSDGAIDTGNLVIGPWASGTAGVRITNTGNVGIGTANPTELLQFTDVASGSDVRISRKAAVGHAAGNVPSSLRLAISDGSEAGVFIMNERNIANTFNNQYIRFDSHEGGVSVGERMRITPSGNVGVGTASPGAKLDISQTAAGQMGARILMPTGAENTQAGLRIQGYSPAIELMDKDNVQNWYMGIDDNDANKLLIGRGYGPGQGVTQAVTIDASDNVGIGTTAPAAKLQVVGEVRTTDAGGAVRLWGLGRPSVVRYGTTGAGTGLCTNGSVLFGLGSARVRWEGAASGCPAGTWVCTQAERGTAACDTAWPTTTCDFRSGGGVCTDQPDNLAWAHVADASFQSGREGNHINESGSIGGGGDGQYEMPVWCCSN